MLNEVDALLGGRAAEQIVLGDISTGASNDIAQATNILKRMIIDFGMSDRFRNMTLGKGVLGNAGSEPVLVREFSEDTQKFIDDEIARVMDERYTHVLSLLESHKTLLDYISSRLLEKETMDGKEFMEIIKAEDHCKELESAATANAAAQQNGGAENLPAVTEEKPARKRASSKKATSAAEKDAGAETKPARRGRKPAAKKKINKTDLSDKCFFKGPVPVWFRAFYIKNSCCIQ